jgi:thiamine pyrophosphokinase
MNVNSYKTVILAHGKFPTHRIPIECLRDAETIVCCDGAAVDLISAGREPDFIVGDLDSLPFSLKERFADRIVHDSDQETNDLTKAVNFCKERGFDDILILGATGLREDHTLGNISLLADYVEIIPNIVLMTDFGIFKGLLKSETFETYPGQQISIFSLTPETRITLSGLKYPLIDHCLSSWWQGTLNEACGNSAEIRFDRGKLLVFFQF